MDPNISVKSLLASAVQVLDANDKGALLNCIRFTVDYYREGAYIYAPQTNKSNVILQCKVDKKNLTINIDFKDIHEFENKLQLKITEFINKKGL